MHIIVFVLYVYIHVHIILYMNVQIQLYASTCCMYRSCDARCATYMIHIYNVHMSTHSHTAWQHDTSSLLFNKANGRHRAGRVVTPHVLIDLAIARLPPRRHEHLIRQPTLSAICTCHHSMMPLSLHFH
jgi:hypothetical protein